MTYFPVRTLKLRPDVKLGFDVYLSIAGKYLLYVKSNDVIDVVRLQKLQQKNMKHVYILEKDKTAYENYLKGYSAVLNDPEVPVDKKSDFVIAVSKAAVEDIHENPESKENYMSAQAAALDQVGLFRQHPDALESLLKIASVDQSIYQHSVNVSNISIGLASFLGAPDKVCEVVGLGGLLHDVGRSTSLPKSLDIHKLSTEEREKYLQHPRIGANLLKDKSYVSKDVLDIILLHEERIDGTGFPAGVKKLDQIFQVVGLANLYDRQVTFNGMKPQEAYEFIMNMKPAPYEPEMIEGLLDVLKKNKLF